MLFLGGILWQNLLLMSLADQSGTMRTLRKTTDVVEDGVEYVVTNL